MFMPKPFGTSPQPSRLAPEIWSNIFEHVARDDGDVFPCPDGQEELAALMRVCRSWHVSNLRPPPHTPIDAD
jgi:hypothetical protein